MIELGAFKKILEDNEGLFPLLTLNEFFMEIQRWTPLLRINGNVDIQHFLKF